VIVVLAFGSDSDYASISAPTTPHSLTRGSAAAVTDRITTLCQEGEKDLIDTKRERDLFRGLYHKGEAKSEMLTLEKEALSKENQDLRNEIHQLKVSRFPSTSNVKLWAGVSSYPAANQLRVW